MLEYVVIRQKNRTQRLALLWGGDILWAGASGAVGRQLRDQWTEL